MITNFIEFINEKSIGTENIYKKYYSDIDWKTYCKIINIDPTTIVKTNKIDNKPGKYSKWLLIMYKKGELKLENSLEIEELKNTLIVFNTRWFKYNYKNINDIFKYTSCNNFVARMGNFVEDFEKLTKLEYDILYSDSEWDVLIPLNFAASFKYSKGTSWCSQNFNGYEMWSRLAVLYRIINKKNKEMKFRLTWIKDNITKNSLILNNWAWIRYPEFKTDNNPFDYEKILKNNNSNPNLDKLKYLFENLPKEAIDKCISYYNENKKEI